MLLERKASLAQDDPSQYTRLIEQADLFLQQMPESVMQKRTVPPSGDKHDYLSLARSWWPDPNHPDGLPYIRRDGRVNPEARGDSSDYPTKKRLFERVYTLGMAAFHTDASRYAKKAVSCKW